MSYTLQHTAEAIDYKLNLIEKNKNLLPYPYGVNFQTGFEDVGDGSVLVTAATIIDGGILLTPAGLLLPAGTYTASIEVTDIIDTATGIINPGFNLEIKDVEVDQAGKFTLSNETTIYAYLATPAVEFNVGTGLLVKPQIEEGDKKTSWVPYMKTIGSYVDERFNSVNTKLAKLANTEILPAVTTEDAGKFLRVDSSGNSAAVEVATCNGEVV